MRGGWWVYKCCWMIGDLRRFTSTLDCGGGPPSSMTLLALPIHYTTYRQSYGYTPATSNMRTAIDAIRATPSRISRLYLASKPSPPGRHCITNSIHRQYTSPTTPSPDPLLDLIQQSPDLRSRDEASQELRWIRDEVRSSLQSRAAELFGSDIGSDALGSGSSTLGDKEVQLEIESISALRGVEEGIVRGLVERRAKGEPLQYVLGESCYLIRDTGLEVLTKR